MPNTEEKPIIDLLTQNVLETRFRDIDQATIDNTKRRIIDTIGDAIGGAGGPGSAELVELVKDWGGKKEATILAYGIKGPAHDVALVNCSFSRTFDRGPLSYLINGNLFPDEPYGKRFVSHTSETTVLTAVALGESTGINGKELITALVAGDDLVARLLIATDRAQPGQAPTPAQRGAVGRGSPITFGATAIAGRLLGLNSFQMRNAFGIAITMMPRGGTKWSANDARGGWLGVKDPWFAAQAASGRDENSLTKLGQGLMARSGINAAQLAKAGWIGLEDAFFGEHGGYYSGLASCNHPDRVTVDLGKKYYVEQAFKPYPGGRPTGAPADAALLLVRKHDIKVDEIEEVILHLSPPAAHVHYSKPFRIGGYPTGDALFSHYFIVASALVRKSAKNENFTEKFIRDPKVQTLISKIKLAHLDKPEGIELEVKMKDGRKFSEYVRTALGEPSNPLSRDGLIAKFMEQVEFSQMVDKKDAEKLVGLLERLEEVDNVRKIVKLAAKRNKST